ncbi:MAG: Hemolysin-type calcium-binding repeat (2 copies) [Rhodobacteraceae bacterium HLUCCA08]|nr:MAG: Hemolysin-type calcium-binding repeat (2 copies) [Rhodobacteraceae bacterium HLUCCA08]
MTTYIYNAFEALKHPVLQDTYTHIQYRDFQIVAPEDETGFTLLDPSGGALPEPPLDVDSELYDLRFGESGIFVDVDPDQDLVRSVRLDWTQGVAVNQTDLLIFEDDQRLLVIELGGDPLPAFASGAEFTGFVGGVISADGTAGAPFDPGSFIPFTSLTSLLSTTENDAIFGTPAGDTFFGGLGNDTITGETGNDTLFGGDGADRILGDDGDDTIYGGEGYDVLYGGAGDDVFFGGTGYNQMYGGAGNDTYFGGDVTGDQVSFIEASSGISLYLEFPDLDLGGGMGVDTFFSIDRFVGSPHDDRMVGDDSFNRLFGGSGNDIIRANGGTGNFLNGGSGDDDIRGSDGDDTVYGMQGQDIIATLDGADVIYGGDEADWISSGRGNDIVHGDDGDDTIRTNRGNDTAYGGSGADDIRGGGGNDLILGGGDDDYLVGENGADTLDGGAGDDVLIGGFDATTPDGLTDTFVYRTGADGGGYDRIRGWEDGIDVIDLTAFGFTDFDTQVDPLATDVAAGLRIDFGGGDVLLVEDFTRADFDAGDVLI